VLPDDLAAAAEQHPGLRLIRDQGAVISWPGSPPDACLIAVIEREAEEIAEGGQRPLGRVGLGFFEGALMRFKPEKDWAANAGLAFARSRLEALKKDFPEMSFGDLWSFAGTVAIEEMGGPKINWRPGRRDMVETVGYVGLPDGLLPDADGRDKKDKAADHLRDIFGRMGFNDREIVALSGAHALGRCHTDRSGYWGPWTFAPTTFSNQYFVLLLSEQWKPKTMHEGKPWKGPFQYEDKTGALMMLPTDVALIQDPKMRVIVEEYAKDEKKFFDDFAKAWLKLQELGVRAFSSS